jgi:hypothetical protein
MHENALKQFKDYCYFVISHTCMPNGCAGGEKNRVLTKKRVSNINKEGWRCPHMHMNIDTVGSFNRGYH